MNTHYHLFLVLKLKLLLRHQWILASSVALRHWSTPLLTPVLLYQDIFLINFQWYSIRARRFANCHGLYCISNLISLSIILICSSVIFGHSKPHKYSSIPISVLLTEEVNILTSSIPLFISPSSFLTFRIVEMFVVWLWKPTTLLVDYPAHIAADCDINFYTLHSLSTALYIDVCPLCINCGVFYIFPYALNVSQKTQSLWLL